MKSKVNIQFGRHLARLRQEKLLSQEELAERCNLHRTYIGSLERAEKSPTLDTLEKIARGLEITITELFLNWDEEN